MNFFINEVLNVITKFQSNLSKLTGYIRYSYDPTPEHTEDVER
jgi:hypothetical protein